MTIRELRERYVEQSGSLDGWNVLLDGFEIAQALYLNGEAGPRLAVSKPFPTGFRVLHEIGDLAREVEIGGGMAVIVIDDVEALERRVMNDALKFEFRKSALA